MRLKDIVELIRVDMPDHTDGPFDVRLESDDGGTHVVIYVEKGYDASKTLSAFSTRFKETRVLVMRCPEGFLPLDR